MAEQLAQLFDATLGSVVRFDGPAGIGEYVGAWSAAGTQLTGQTIDLTGGTATAQVYQVGHSVAGRRYGDHSADPFLDEFSLGGGFAAPISAGGSCGGRSASALAAGRTIPADAQERLSSFADLAAMAISSTEALETLSRAATTDPLTGLANYRVFHERLAAEIERSVPPRAMLSVAVLDLDHFKQINDTHGHQIGDRRAVRGRNAPGPCRTQRRARGTDRWRGVRLADARGGGRRRPCAAERVRQAIKNTPFDTAGTLTMSIGVCSNEYARTTEELVGFADQALYRAKQGGRNMTSSMARTGSPAAAAAIGNGYGS